VTSKVLVLVGSSAATTTIKSTGTLVDALVLMIPVTKAIHLLVKRFFVLTAALVIEAIVG